MESAISEQEQASVVPQFDATEIMFGSANSNPDSEPNNGPISPPNADISGSPSSQIVHDVHCPIDQFYYLNQNIPLSNASNTIENLNMTSYVEFNKDITRVLKIKDEFYKFIHERFQEEERKEEEEEFQKHKKIIDEGMKHVQLMMESFQKILEKTQTSEKHFKDALDSAEKDMHKLDDFSSFMTMIETKHKNIKTDTMNESIRKICDELLENNLSHELKTIYEKNIYLTKYYLHNFIKKMNQGNIGTTCSMCLQRPVNTFLNPCGHTSCDECLDRLRTLHTPRTDEINCFLCRRKVSTFHRLYFT